MDFSRASRSEACRSGRRSIGWRCIRCIPRVPSLTLTIAYSREARGARREARGARREARDTGLRVPHSFVSGAPVSCWWLLIDYRRAVKKRAFRFTRASHTALTAQPGRRYINPRASISLKRSAIAPTVNRLCVARSATGSLSTRSLLPLDLQLTRRSPSIFIALCPANNARR